MTLGRRESLPGPVGKTRARAGIVVRLTFERRLQLENALPKSPQKTSMSQSAATAKRLWGEKTRKWRGNVVSWMFRCRQRSCWCASRQLVLLLSTVRTDVPHQPNAPGPAVLYAITWVDAASVATGGHCWRNEVGVAVSTGCGGCRGQSQESGFWSDGNICTHRD